MSRPTLPDALRALLTYSSDPTQPLTVAWARRDTPLDSLVEFLNHPAAEALEELAVFAGCDAPSVLEAVASHRPTGLKMLRFGATSPVDLTPLQSHLAEFSRLALHGPVGARDLDLPRLDFLGWADRRGQNVRFESGQLPITELWARTTPLALKRFLASVRAPNLERATVADPLPLLQWRGIGQLQHLTVTRDSPRIQAILSTIRARNPNIVVQVEGDLARVTAA